MIVIAQVDHLTAGAWAACGEISGGKVVMWGTSTVSVMMMTNTVMMMDKLLY